MKTAGIVIIRILYDPGTFVDHGQHQSLDHAVCHFHFLRVGEIPLVQVGKDVRNACRTLIGRQCLGQGRVQDGEARTDGIAAGASFEHAFFLRDDAVRAAFAASRRNGQDGTYGQRIFDSFSASLPNTKQVGE